MNKPFNASRTPGVQRRSMHQVNFRWGLITALLVFAIVYAAFIGLPFGGGRKFTVLTDRAAGIRAGKFTKVRMSGVDVGYLESVKRAANADNPDLSELTIRLDDKAPVMRRDARIKLRPRLFLEGNYFLDVEPGTPVAEKLGNGTLPPSSFSTFVASDEVFSSFDRDGRNDFTEGLKGFGEVLDEGGSTRLASLLRELPKLTSDTAVVMQAARGTTTGEWRQMISHLTRVVGTVNSSAPALSSAIQDGNVVWQTMAVNQGNLGRSLQGLGNLVDKAGPAFASLNSATPGARVLASDFGRLLDASPTSLNKALPALNEVRSFTKSGDLPRMFDQLGPMAGIVTSQGKQFSKALGKFGIEARCLSKLAVPALFTKIQDGPHTTGLPAYQEIVSAMVGLASSSQSFDGVGPTIRLSATLGNQLIVPGNNRAGGFYNLGPRPLLGSSPPKMDKPPLRPDVPCETQEPAKINVPAAPIVGTQSQTPVDSAKLNKAFDELGKYGAELSDAASKYARGEQTKSLQERMNYIFGLGPEGLR